MDINQIRAEFVDACSDGKLDLINFYIDKYYDIIKEAIDNGFWCACGNNQLETARFLLTSEKLPVKADIHTDGGLGIREDYKDICFNECCEKGYYELVEFLTTSPELEEHSDIYAQNYYGFNEACKKGHYKIVEFLTSSKKLSKHIPVGIENTMALSLASRNGQLEIVKYLLTSPKLKQHADMNANRKIAFKLACLDFHIDVVSFFIFEMNIQVTKELRNFLENNEKLHYVLELFDKRETYYRLTENVQDKTIDHTKQRNKL